MLNLCHPFWAATRAGNINVSSTAPLTGGQPAAIQLIRHQTLGGFALRDSAALTHGLSLPDDLTGRHPLVIQSGGLGGVTYHQERISNIGHRREVALVCHHHHLESQTFGERSHHLGRWLLEFLA